METRNHRMITIKPVDLPGNTHQLAENSTVKIISAARYRISWADILPPDSPVFIRQKPSEPIGVAGAESQEHSLLWSGPADIIAGYLGDPAQIPPWDQLNQAGSWTPGWPNIEQWLKLMPAVTWCPEGQGIVTTYTYPDGNGQVTVYETLGLPTIMSMASLNGNNGPAGPVPIVTYHCTRCHTENYQDRRIMSACPDDRQLACQEARKHMLPGKCKGNNVARPRPLGYCQALPLYRDSYQARSSCAEVRAASEHTAAWHAATR
jgi:hypothetical protein